MLTSDIDPELFRGEIGGKTVIVTGGAGGIGAAIVCVFHDHGANVVVADLPSTRQAASTLLASRPKDKANTMFVEVDIQDWESMKHLYRTTVERFGSVDIVIANAGTMEKLPFFDIDHLDEEPTGAFKVIDINVKGTMNSESVVYAMTVALYLLFSLSLSLFSFFVLKGVYIYIYIYVDKGRL
jgi:NAD(P)-dependent dehydrogenase (short-subunit alcohol dehydrogenase family)